MATQVADIAYRTVTRRGIGLFTRSSSASVRVRAFSLPVAATSAPDTRACSSFSVPRPHARPRSVGTSPSGPRWNSGSLVFRPFDLLGLTPWTRRCRPPVDDLRPHRHWIQRHPTSRSPIARLDRPGTGKRPHRCQCGCRYWLLRAGRRRRDRSRPLTGRARPTPWDEEGEGRSRGAAIQGRLLRRGHRHHDRAPLARPAPRTRRTTPRRRQAGRLHLGIPRTGRSCGCLRSTRRRSAS